MTLNDVLAYAKTHGVAVNKDRDGRGFKRYQVGAQVVEWKDSWGNHGCYRVNGEGSLGVAAAIYSAVNLEVAARKAPTVAETPPQPVLPPACDPLNAKFLVLDFERVYEGNTKPTRIQMYLLPPGGWFEGFGGSRGLLVGKTPSLVVRMWGGGQPGQQDAEYDLAAKGVWQYLVGEGLTNFRSLYTNGAAPRDKDGLYKADGTPT